MHEMVDGYFDADDRFGSKMCDINGLQLQPYCGEVSYREGGEFRADIAI